MALVSTPATVLKSYPYSETSKILRLLSRDVGLVSVIAKGARRPKSRFGGILEPFTDGIATFYMKEGRDLHTLSGFELGRERQALGAELVRFAGAGLITEMVLRFAPATSDPALFDQLRRSLDRLVGAESSLETALIQEAWRIVRCLGFAPAVNRCSRCGGSAFSGDILYFDLAGGALHCAGCASSGPGSAGSRLDRTAGLELAALVEGRTPNGGRPPRPLQRTLLRDFIAYHLPEGGPLKSFRFLQDQLG